MPARRSTRTPLAPTSAARRRSTSPATSRRSTAARSPSAAASRAAPTRRASAASASRTGARAVPERPTSPPRDWRESWISLPVGDTRPARMHGSIGDMKWADFATAAPELAELGMTGFREQNLCLIGTLAADGWPRISPNEVYFPDGELLLGMMRESRKSKDLERDGRITVMTPQSDREAKRGDFKIYGRAVEVAEPALRQRYGETIFDAIGWRPTEPYPLWSVDIERAAYISFGDRHRLLRWSADRGVEELPHPDDDPDRGAPD